MFASCSIGLILLGLAFYAAAQTYPAIVEFDVVFPRNDTYEPTTLMPIVFAIRNPQASIPLIIDIEWIVGKVGDANYENVEGSTSFTQITYNYTTDPYFVVFGTNRLNDTEGSFSLLWTLGSGNCSHGAGPQGVRLGGSGSYNHTIFTIRKGGNKPSLVTSLDPSTCSRQGRTYNVTGVLPVQDPIQYGGRNTCAVISDVVPPATPCDIKIDDTIAASISASMTAEACATVDAMGSYCPSPTMTNMTSMAMPAGLNFRKISANWAGLVVGPLVSLFVLYVLQ